MSQSYSITFTFAAMLLAVVHAQIMQGDGIAGGNQTYDNQTASDNCVYNGMEICQKGMAPGCWYDGLGGVCRGCYSAPMDVCSRSPGCVWDAGVSMCKKAPQCYDFNQDATACAQGPNCRYKTFGYCQAGLSGEDPCVTSGSQQQCTAAGPNCKWDGMYCFYDSGCQNDYTKDFCITKPGCTWNSYGNCEINTPVNNCFEISDPTQCSKANFGGPCLWKSETQCYTRRYDFVTCWNHTDSLTCNAQTGTCMWKVDAKGFGFCEEYDPCRQWVSDPMKCQSNGCGYRDWASCIVASCYDWKDSTSCTAAKCFWDANMNTCNTVAPQQGCWGQPQDKCSQVPGCSWFEAPECVRVDPSSTTECGSASWDEKTCLGRAGCSWKPSVLACRNAVPPPQQGCWGQPQDKCSQVPGCSWFEAPECVRVDPSSTTECGSASWDEKTCLGRAGCSWKPSVLACRNAPTMGGGDYMPPGPLNPVCASLCGNRTQCKEKLQSLDKNCRNFMESGCVDKFTSAMDLAKKCDMDRCKCRGGVWDSQAELQKRDPCVNQTGLWCGKDEQACNAKHGACMVSVVQSGVNFFKVTQPNVTCANLGQQCADVNSWNNNQKCVLERCSRGWDDGCDVGFVCGAAPPIPPVCAALKCDSWATCVNNVMAIGRQMEAGDNCKFELVAPTCQVAVASKFADLHAPDCERERCKCLQGTFDETKFSQRPKGGFDIRSEVYCTNLGGSTCIQVSTCLKRFETCRASKVSEIFQSIEACKNDPMMKTCVGGLVASSSEANQTQRCVLQSCADPFRLGLVKYPNYGRGGDDKREIRNCSDVHDEGSCNNAVESPGCAWDSARNYCQGTLKEFIPPFESRAKWLCQNKSIEEACIGTLPSFDKEQCKCPSPGDCGVQYSGLVSGCNNPQTQKAIEAASLSDSTAKTDMEKCYTNGETCFKAALSEDATARCAAIRKCIYSTTQCTLTVFSSRSSNTLFANGNITSCLKTRDEAGVAAICRNAFCSGAFPQVSKVSEEVAKGIMQAAQSCSVASICDAVAPVVVLVTVEVKVEVSVKLQGVEFAFYNNATPAQQKSFEANIVKDLYATLGFDPATTKIVITRIYQGSIAIDYEVVTTVTQEKGAPTPTAPPMPSAGTTLTLTNTKQSLATDLSVPAEQIALSSAVQTTDPVVKVKVTENTPNGPTTSVTCTTANGTSTSCDDDSSAAINRLGVMMALVFVFASLFL